MRSPTQNAYLRMTVLGFVTVSGMVAGCISPGARARRVKDNEALRLRVERLERTIAQRDSTIAMMQQQIGELKGYGPNRPADLFAPVRIEIVSRSGGQDYDGRPGDDGVTVYVRPRDADGDIVKSPGRISVQLLDNTKLDTPKLVGVYRYEDPERLRKTWYGKLGTQHYTLKCPFPPGFVSPPRLDVKVEFVDYLTGAMLTALGEMSVQTSPQSQ